MISTEELFERVVTYPDFEYKERLAELIGLEEHKARLSKILRLLVNPMGLESWQKQYHPSATSILNYVLKRPPLVILEGDVGSGKSELAMTIGDLVARQEDIEIILFPLSLSTRGEGRVGQMTQLVSAAFEHTFQQAEKFKNRSGNSHGAIILLVDEADALTQSRESSQMHHEDKAGVNAFIRGVDRLGNGKLPAAVIMCTNRVNSLDPAIKRRAADILKFDRPKDNERKLVLEKPLKEIGLTDNQISEIVTLTGPKNGRGFGFTFSDLSQRLLPLIVLDAYPDKAVRFDRALEITESIIPTPPFKESNN